MHNATDTSDSSQTVGRLREVSMAGSGGRRSGAGGDRVFGHRGASARTSGQRRSILHLAGSRTPHWLAHHSHLAYRSHRLLGAASSRCLRGRNSPQSF